jgi:ABC-type phosphate transport system substrate-binding protein
MKGKIVKADGKAFVTYQEETNGPEGYALKPYYLELSAQNNAEKYEDGQDVNFEPVMENIGTEEIPAYIQMAFVYTNQKAAESWEEIWKEWANTQNGKISFLQYLVNNFNTPKRK